MILFLLYIYHRNYRHKSQDKNNHTIISNCSKRSISIMDHKTLELATDNFGDSNMLGAGGFGCVYKGKLEGNLCVAVKRLSGGNLDAIKEFQTEVELLSKIQHPNIITLLGYSIHSDTRLLIYELMEFGSLETQLHGPSRGSALTWHLRMKIALDAARGLEYLHEHCHPPVIHRDLKSSNILLDSDFNAKGADSSRCRNLFVILILLNKYGQVSTLPRMYHVQTLLAIRMRVSLIKLSENYSTRVDFSKIYIDKYSVFNCHTSHSSSKVIFLVLVAKICLEFV
ncbi:probable receptor-like protein kinase At1g80640 isoform X4 [Sesamum indicum]|uniref:Probable receptor-like protein kinase At1g80640 isoform X4 n=1 Tax=Sesamum indicum TaxID=4182 RepID=A0A8M8V402_SESIN|nr:probable receptor-like protein kinase At1g80640 isoform X4 [Sesamum indicum]